MRAAGPVVDDRGLRPDLRSHDGGRLYVVRRRICLPGADRRHSMGRLSTFASPLPALRRHRVSRGSGVPALSSHRPQLGVSLPAGGSRGRRRPLRRHPSVLCSGLRLRHRSGRRLRLPKAVPAQRGLPEPHAVRGRRRRAQTTFLHAMTDAPPPRTVSARSDLRPFAIGPNERQGGHGLNPGKTGPWFLARALVRTLLSVPAGTGVCLYNNPLSLSQVRALVPGGARGGTVVVPP